MEVILRATAKIDITRVIDVESIEELREAVAQFEKDAWLDVTLEHEGGAIDFSIDDWEGISEPLIDDDENNPRPLELDDYIDIVEDDTEHPLNPAYVDEDDDPDVK